MSRLICNCTFYGLHVVSWRAHIVVHNDHAQARAFSYSLEAGGAPALPADGFAVYQNHFDWILEPLAVANWGR
jgi:hypothetical protein